MINVIKEAQGTALVIRLAGSVDETVNFDQALGEPTQPEVHLYLKELSRLNSFGVRQWVKYFSRLSDAGKTVRIFEASPGVVQQLNFMVNFVPKGIVESVCAPYICTNCKGNFMSVFKSADLKKSGFQVPKLNCPKCGTPTAEFDDIEEEYFGFLAKK